MVCRTRDHTSGLCFASQYTTFTHTASSESLTIVPMSTHSSIVNYIMLALLDRYKQGCNTVSVPLTPLSSSHRETSFSLQLSLLGKQSTFYGALACPSQIQECVCVCIHCLDNPLSSWLFVGNQVTSQAGQVSNIASYFLFCNHLRSQLAVNDNTRALFPHPNVALVLVANFLVEGKYTLTLFIR